MAKFSVPLQCDALPEARAVALNRKATHYARIAAFRAVRAIGAEADKLDIRDYFLREASTLNRECFTELLEELPPNRRSVEWVLACIVKLQPKDRYRMDGLLQALDIFAQSLSIDFQAELLEAIGTLISKRPVVELHYFEISERHGWLMPVAAKAVARLILARHPTALQTTVLAILQKLPLVQDFFDWDFRENQPDFPALVAAWRELNYQLFWYEVVCARRIRNSERKVAITNFRQANLLNSYWQFRSDDFDRILADIESRPLRDDRLVALSLAFYLYADAGRPKKLLLKLTAITGKTSVLSEALHIHLHPQADPEHQRWKLQHAKWQRQNRKRKALAAKREQELREVIAKNIDKIRAPQLPQPSDVSNWQYHLHERMRRLSPRSMHLTEGRWQVLEAEFGKDVALAFRDGVVAFWRRYKPKLRFEGKSTNHIPFSVIFGLTGLRIEACEIQNWASTLNKDDVDIAFRYAMAELNGFPKWISSLFEAFPELITSMLLREVDKELRNERVKVDSHYILADLSSRGTWAWTGISTGIFERLKAYEPKNLTNLNDMLNIVHAAGIDTEEISQLAGIRSADRRLAHAALWYAVWTGVTPEKAIPSLRVRLANIKEPAKQTSFAMQFITHLLGGYRNTEKNGNKFRTPEHLKNLYTLMHHYIREKEDIQRAGRGVYSPGLRYDAQEARNHLFALLKEIPGKEAYLALMELGQLHPEPSSRAWMVHHAKTKAELDADLTPWSIKQTLEFQTVIERTPANHLELFELAEMRFLDLKDNLEHGDSSIANILSKGAAKETDMRKYIGDWLRDRAQSRYVIPQEEELADNKRMDLRLHGVGFDAPVPIELKLAEKWSGPELFERLENQLCGNYLRDNRSNRGLFVLVYL